VAVANVASTLNAHYGDKWGLEDQHVNQGCPLYVAHALRGEGFDASEDGTGRGTPIVPVPAIAFDCKASGQSGFGVGDVASTMRAMGHSDSHQNGGGHQAVAFSITPSNSNKDYNAREADKAQAITSGGNRPSARGGDLVANRWAVRRLTPTECERLQGFPDGYTNVPWRGKDSAPDGPRYKALGNSMAVNAMRWLGRRIDLVSSLNQYAQAAQ